MTNTEDERVDKARNRLKGFGLHLFGYFIVMLILVPLNAFVYDGSAWSVFPLVGWGSALAVHAALVLGLFGRSNPNQ